MTGGEAKATAGVCERSVNVSGKENPVNKPSARKPLWLSGLKEPYRPPKGGRRTAGVLVAKTGKDTRAAGRTGQLPD